jgi:hypothetical protein
MRKMIIVLAMLASIGALKCTGAFAQEYNPETVEFVEELYKMTAFLEDAKKYIREENGYAALRELCAAKGAMDAMGLGGDDDFPELYLLAHEAAMAQDLRRADESWREGVDALASAESHKKKYLQIRRRLYGE